MFNPEHHHKMACSSTLNYNQPLMSRIALIDEIVENLRKLHIKEKEILHELEAIHQEQEKLLQQIPNIKEQEEQQWESMWGT